MPIILLPLTFKDVGKSSIIMRYVHKDFVYNIGNTVGCEFMTKQVYFKGKTIKFMIWDTAGQEKFNSIIGHAYKGNLQQASLFLIS